MEDWFNFDLNTIGDTWHNFWNKPVPMAANVTQFGLVPQMGAAKEESPTIIKGTTTPSAMAAGLMAGPAIVTGIAAPVATAVGTAIAAPVSKLGQATAETVAKASGLNENAQEMFGDIAGFSAGMLAGGFTGKATQLISNPLYRSAHFYRNVTPGGYHDIKGVSKASQVKSWVKDLLSLKPADTSTVKWDEDALAHTLQDWGYGYLPISLIKDARRNAFRLYNNLEQDVPIFLKNTDGSYRANLDLIKEYILKAPDSEFGEGMAQWAKKGLINVKLPKTSGTITTADPLTTAGGNVKVTAQDMGSYLKGLVEDLWDVQPFSRKGDEFTRRMISEPLRKKADELYTKLYYPLYKNRFAYNHLGGKQLNTARYELDLSKYKWAQKLDNYMKKFEVGSVTGSTPWMQRTPFTYIRKTGLTPEGKLVRYNTLGNFNENNQYNNIINPWDSYDINNIINYDLFNPASLGSLTKLSK